MLCPDARYSHRVADMFSKKNGSLLECRTFCDCYFDEISLKPGSLIKRRLCALHLKTDIRGIEMYGLSYRLRC